MRALCLYPDADNVLRYGGRLSCAAALDAPPAHGGRPQRRHHEDPRRGHTRGECEVESAYLDEALPKLAALGAPQEIAALQPDALAPICGASFTRITAELRLSENTSCMICGDVGDLTGGGRTALLCELELELKQGSEEALSAFARALMDTYHLSEQPLSKLQRARALAE